MHRHCRARGLAAFFVLFCLMPPDSARAAGDSDPLLSWREEARYSPPDYEGFFPDSARGAAELAALWTSPEREELEASRLLASVRQGFRRYEGNRAELLRWVGRRFVEGHIPQDPDAVEIMYHALDVDPEQEGGAATRSAAIRFGVSVVRPLSPNLLRALAALSIASEDGDDLSRIVWAIADQREEALAMLEEYADHTENVDREKVTVVRRLWSRELKAHAWVRELRVAQVRAAFGEELPGILKQLDSGTSESRRQALEFILRNEVLSILPESALAGFAACASDADPGVRALVARLVGERWVLAATYMHPRAVDILIKLSRDEAELVCHNAVYYGLSAVSPKDEVIITRLLEVAATRSDTRLYERILWGLRPCQPQVKRLLDAWRLSNEPEKVLLSQRLYEGLAK